MSGAFFFCENITKWYEGRAVVKDVSLELPSGGVISLLGPSGTGKTTLFNALSGVDRPGMGRVVLDGKDITGVSGRVSYMMQNDLLLEYRTVLDNVILPLLIRGRNKKEARRYGASFFGRFGLSGYEKKYPRQLSGGMRQRAALLRTCLQKNPVILLDEPFSALDSLTRRSMHAWFQEIAAEMKFSALFITHDIEEALVLSDTVYLLTGCPGRISARFGVNAPRPRSDAFAISDRFIYLKKDILEALHV
jgi:ABC-type nitrate/sulfonate/bicarbonate transport system ATPase subunit